MCMSVNHLQIGALRYTELRSSFWYEVSTSKDNVGLWCTQLLAWLAVLFRLYVRVKVLREPGLDDVFVLLAVVCLS
jgi:hypothetical protein